MKIGLIGVGHLGKIHLKCLGQIEEWELVGFYDADLEAAKTVAKDFSVPFFDSVEALIEASEVVDLVTPTSTHFELGKKILNAGKHLFVEKPICAKMEEALELHNLAKSVGCKIQVGHVERFNPAFLAATQLGTLSPKFIEGHRLAQFNPRGTDVSVVLDLMIHDLDLILKLIQSAVKQVHANGVPVVSETPDICNARIEFENGCVANLTASRISVKNMRKLRLFQPSSYVGIDMLSKEVQQIKLYDSQPDNPSMELQTNHGKKWIEISMPEVTPNNAIVEELKSFHQSIRKDLPTKINAYDAYRSIKLAEQINEAVNQSIQLFNQNS